MVRYTAWLLSAALLFAPCALPQVPPRPETIPAAEAPEAVTEALRARVNQFFQYHVEHGPALRRAMDLVAEDTKDEYFASNKMKVEKFNITDVKFAPGFQQAMVVLDVTREWNFYAQTKPEVVTLPMVTYWKIEEGEWRWYKDKSMESITPMGLSNLQTMGKLELLRQNPDGTVNLPPDFNKEETLLAQAQLILTQSKVDKNTVTLSLQKESEETVTFQNGYGEVNLELYGVPDIPGLSGTLEKPTLHRNENGVVHFRYSPPPPDPHADAEAPPAVRIPPSFVARLVVIPHNQIFDILVKLDKGSETAQ
jgi:hypothetical protein